MANLSEKDISKFYDEISQNLNRYTDLHIQVINLLIPEINNYITNYSIIKGHSQYYCFGCDYIVEKSGFDNIIVFQILNDFVKDGLLWIANRLPDTIVFGVTDRGNNCFKRIVELYREKK
jgi:hypothetical protein